MSAAPGNLAATCQSPAGRGANPNNTVIQSSITTNPLRAELQTGQRIRLRNGLQSSQLTVQVRSVVNRDLIAVIFARLFRRGIGAAACGIPDWNWWIPRARIDCCRTAERKSRLGAEVTAAKNFGFCYDRPLRGASLGWISLRSAGGTVGGRCSMRRNAVGLWVG